MSKTEFVVAYERLCAGFRRPCTTESAEALYGRLQAVEGAVWQDAVAALLCEPWFPTLQAILAAIEQATVCRRRADRAPRGHAGTRTDALAAPEDYLVQRALTRWLRGSRTDLERLIDEEYQRAQDAGAITAEDRTFYHAYKLRTAEWEARRQKGETHADHDTPAPP